MNLGLSASVRVDVPDALKRVGFACWKRKRMRKAWVGLFCFVLFPKSSFLVEAQHRVKRDTFLTKKRPIEYATVNPLSSKPSAYYLSYLSEFFQY